MSRLTWAVLVPMVALAGCASDPITRAQNLGDQFIDDVCSRCPAFSSGATSTAMCEANLGAFRYTPTQEGCVRDVYAAHTAELDAFYDCTEPLSREFFDCISAAIDVCPPSSTATTACNDRFLAGVRGCPALSSATADELSACTAP